MDHGIIHEDGVSYPDSLADEATIHAISRARHVFALVSQQKSYHVRHFLWPSKSFDDQGKLSIFQGDTKSRNRGCISQSAAKLKRSIQNRKVGRIVLRCNTIDANLPCSYLLGRAFGQADDGMLQPRPSQQHYHGKIE